MAPLLEGDSPGADLGLGPPGACMVAMVGEQMHLKVGGLRNVEAFVGFTIRCISPGRCTPGGQLQGRSKSMWCQHEDSCLETAGNDPPSAQALVQQQQEQASADCLPPRCDDSCPPTDHVRERPLKLVVTSATLDGEKFSAYFGDCPVRAAGVPAQQAPAY